MEALIIIDLQAAYVGHRLNEMEFCETVKHINHVADLFRKAGRPVIVVRDISEGNNAMYRNVQELDIQETDAEILKQQHNSFWETKLDELLKASDVDFVILAGSAAEYCVTATYFGAVERGYKSAILQNGVLADTPAGMQSIMKTKTQVSYQVLEYYLRN